MKRLRELIVLDRLEDDAHVRGIGVRRRDGARARAVDHAWTLVHGEPRAEPASQEARDVLRFFLESFTDPQMSRGAPVGRVPSMVTLTPLYKEEVKYSAKHLSRRVDGETSPRCDSSSA